MHPAVLKLSSFEKAVKTLTSQNLIFWKKRVTVKSWHDYQLETKFWTISKKLNC